MTTNPELELAFNYVNTTNRHLFLTGKAGTGKTTFLHRIRDEVPKRMAVVAPTGVAAINARGVTIHSLFQLPFGVLTPDRIRAELPKRRFSRKKIDLIRSLDLLVIDEISMVRADVLDALDAVLRRYRGDKRPFGGLQLLMIGDLHQLPPVVKDQDWEELRPHYDTAYFFGSLALRQAQPTVVQLKHIFRQSDGVFIDLLNKVRNNRIDQQVLDQLNQRYRPDFSLADAKGYITLTSHNHTARAINVERLNELPGKTYRFRSRIENDFPESMYPNEPELTFKLGAQVMFNKNDSYPDRLYYNGKIGVITAIEDEKITVQCPGEDPIEVLPTTWENRKYELDSSTKEVSDRIVGTYAQHPLRLAWAITIHKSQGLTFERVVIDAAAAFAHGQVYVALSRCKSFEGIVLRTRIGTSSVRTDTVVRGYTESAEQNQPTPEQLRADQYAYQAECLRELFDMSALQRAMERLERVFLEHERAIQGTAFAEFSDLYTRIEEKIVRVAEKFGPHLTLYFREAALPSENEALTERLAGAGRYFTPQLREELLPALRGLDVLTDNQAVRQQADERLEELQLVVFTKARLFDLLADGFDPGAYVKSKADAELDFARSKKGTPQRSAAPKDSSHPELYQRLSAWRGYMAEADGVAAFTIAPNRALLEVAEVLPTSTKSLLRVTGFGKKRVAAHGEVILAIVDQYLAEKELPSDQLQFATGRQPRQPRKPREDTKQVSLDLFRAGKSVAEIAAERNFAESTIFGHLAHWVGEGELAATQLIEPATLEAVSAYLRQQPDQPLSDAFKHFDGRYNYGELRVARKYLELETEEE